ncbi:MAG: TIGR04283 family arsenosugar biosynthesis glycosyltransferase [Bacteroidota bacterium]
MSTLSVIIPTLNEAHRIGATLQAVRAGAGPEVEVIVADGGSTDDTVRLAAPLATVVHAPRGRARQMNAGAREASGRLLYFLHADTRPPQDYAPLIRHALQNAEAGAFRLSFDHPSLIYSFYGWCTTWPTPLLCFGDRSLFVRRSAFEHLGGFPDIPIFEDLEMARRLYQRGMFTFMPQAVVTSARRFERVGIIRQQLANAALWAGYLLRLPHHRLQGFYPPEPPSDTP